MRSRTLTGNQRRVLTALSVGVALFVAAAFPAHLAFGHAACGAGNFHSTCAICLAFSGAALSDTTVAAAPASCPGTLLPLPAVTHASRGHVSLPDSRAPPTLPV